LAFLKLFARNKIVWPFLNVEENSIHVHILKHVLEKSEQNYLWPNLAFLIFGPGNPDTPRFLMQDLGLFAVRLNFSSSF